MLLVTAAQARQLDRKAIDEWGISEAVLMENAGTQSAQVAEREFGPLAGRRVVICFGKGRNGGDALVCARHLLNQGAQVALLGLGTMADCSQPTQFQWGLLEKLGQAPRQASLQELLEALGQADLVIDGLLGTGSSLPLREPVLAWISALQAWDGPLLALDLPSGLNPDTGQLPGPTVHATVTVTYGWVKRGLVLEPGRRQVGKLVVADIGLPRIFAAGLQDTADYSTSADLAPLLPWRDNDSHKRSLGVTLIIAGSQSYAGAAALAARAAYRSGLGLVRAYVPKSVLGPLQSLVPECVAKAGYDEQILSEADLASLIEWALDCQSLVLGPGLGREPGTQALVKALWAQVKQPILVDADALFALAQGPWVKPAGPRLLTPHDGELARFLKPELTASFKADRLEAARQWARQSQVCWLLKGPGSLVASPEGQLSVNSTGGPELASAGTGDVLAGLAGALLAMGLEPWDAGRLAAHWQGLAAESLLRLGIGQGLTATDLADNLPRVRVELAGPKR